MNKFLKRIPPLPFHQSREFKNFTRVQADEFGNIEDLIEQIEKEMYVTTAERALKIYENELGIPVSESKPLEERRGRIKVRELYTGKVGAALLEDIILKHSGVTAKVGFDDGVILVNFNNTSKVALTKSMYSELYFVKPCHLELEYRLNNLLDMLWTHTTYEFPNELKITDMFTTEDHIFGIFFNEMGDCESRTYEFPVHLGITDIMRTETIVDTDTNIKLELENYNPHNKVEFIRPGTYQVGEGEI